MPQLIPDPVLAQQLLSGPRVLLFLAISAGLALLLLQLRRRQRGDRPGLLAVSDRLTLGPRHQVVALKAGGQTLLLGTTPDGIVLLSELAGPEAEGDESAGEPPLRFAAALEAAERGAA